MMPEIIVLMSVYNGELYLKEQINSILNQKNVNVKLLIRIDGSCDSSKIIINDFIKKNPDKIKLIIGDNLGFAMSFTELLKESYNNYSNVDYFAFADQDDIWLENKLFRGVQAIRNEKKSIPVAYCSATTQVDENLKLLGKDTILPVEKLTKSRALIQNYATGCTMVMNRKAVELYISNIPAEIKVHDFLMFQICMFLGKVIYDRKSNILYRQHGTNLIGRPNIIGRMKNRLKGHFLKHTLERQNRNFYNAFHNLLDINDRKLFESFLSYRSNLIMRLKLLFSTSISYTSLEQDFFYRLKILIGTV